MLPTRPFPKYKGQKTLKKKAISAKDFLNVVVMAQVEEQWHYVQAGQVQIPGRTWLFLVQNCCESILAGRLAFSKRMTNRTCKLFLRVSCFISPLSKFVDCNLSNEQKNDVLNTTGQD